MKLTRKQFLGSLGSGTVLLWLQACGGGGGGGYGGGGGGGGMGGGYGGGGLMCGATGAAISGNHGHTLTINEADLDSTTDKTYNIMGTAGHNHTVTFTAAQLGMLKGGQMVTVASTTTSGHMHDVTANCV
ncbi:MAG TPA: hypothetical protein VGQ91_05330 [Ideonella sp.]|jgi:hypothetical protein|nr:hypothetical protein [Ideonella sp.]